MLKPAPIQGLIFDLDDTLVHSQLNFRQIKCDIGCPADMDILIFIETLPNVERALAKQCVEEHEILDAENAQWIPGALPMLRRLRQLHIPLALVTRNCRLATQRKLGPNKALFSWVLTREDAPAKPDPTGLNMIANQWQMSPENIAYVGDYIYDLQAARNANMQAYLFAPNTLPDYAGDADMVIDSHEQIINGLSHNGIAE